jgi:hypothetical protein
MAECAARCRTDRVDAHLVDGRVQPGRDDDDRDVHHSRHRRPALRMQQDPTQTQAAQGDYPPGCYRLRAISCRRRQIAHALYGDEDA